ncbi:ATP-binding cassette domain-containing protein [Halobacteriovorax sp.]|uniref:ATP-binding cassette domain-containing protein n=1 Tax=Halobacteriovorax sp. TaxID=2020862 RepID=UPI003564C665
MIYLSAKNLQVGYNSPIGMPIDLELSKGEILQIKGANGTGKSTVLKTLINEISPLSGQINWKLKGREISYLPQGGENVNNFNFTLEEILKIYEVPESIKSYLRDNLRERLWINASGGEKQLTLILSRITEFTKVLILDEPLNHLDQNARVLIEDLIKKLMSDDSSISVIIVSHLEVQLNKREFILC